MARPEDHAVASCVTTGQQSLVADSRADEGRRAARALWKQGQQATIEDPLDEAFATAAIREFARLQDEQTPGIFKDILTGAEASAEQLNVEPFHGVVEVLQNADDARATRLDIALRKSAGKRELLFVHDGDPLVLPDLVAMSLTFVSTKRGDALAKGRFGIGLKTLGALGEELTVHGGPYHAMIHGNDRSPRGPSPYRRRCRALDQELERLARKACPALLGIFGAGSNTAGALLLAAGDNPERLRSEAAFAKLCGCLPGRGLLRQDHQAPAEPRWGPSRQRGASPDRHGEAEMASPANDGLRREEDGRG